ncbi:MAG: DNA polymerase/3'-5' exonuclease PolX [Phycisphaerales bacterium]|nr:DNA polymerase/3'-5' exonuclease PolX [Phycisphaerales bacterium]
MVNQALARIFDEIADLMEITGGDLFRINSYRRAARTIDDLTENLTDIAKRKELQKIPGIGKGTAERIRQFLEEGHITLHQELLAQVPPRLPQLLQIPGLGPKKVRALYQELGVKNIEQLRAAIEAGKVEKLAGFGPKSTHNIIEGMDFLARSAGRTPIGMAWIIAHALRETIAGFNGVKRVEFAGSLRRGCETIGDIDMLCEADDGEATIQAFSAMPEVNQVLAAGETKGSILVTNPRGGDIQVDLRVVPQESFGAAWQYFTGSKQHNIRLRELAVKKGWRLNEYGLFDGDKSLAGISEEDIYRKLGFSPIPPEVREDRGEIEAEGKLPDLVTIDDIRGDLHVHTTDSDGRNSIEELAEAARQRGYSYLAITNHSKSSIIANGLSIERLLEHVEAIHNLNKTLKGLTLLAGVECDILSDGSLDYPDNILAQLDYVVASIHAGMQQNRDRVTKRSLAALENPYVCTLGHPSGRLIGARDAMDLDWEKIIETAARCGTALELNCSWQRLDLKDVHVRTAVEAGCRIVIATDSHEVQQLDQMHFGIQTARRGWATKTQVLNTLTETELKTWIKKKRTRQESHAPGIFTRGGK